VGGEVEGRLLGLGEGKSTGCSLCDSGEYIRDRLTRIVRSNAADPAATARQTAGLNRYVAGNGRSRPHIAGNLRLTTCLQPVRYSLRRLPDPRNAIEYSIPSVARSDPQPQATLGKSLADSAFPFC